MGIRGKKSTAELSAVTNIPGQRHEPPKDLSDEQAALWRAVISTKPPEWFKEDTLPLLENYCKTVTYCREIAQKLDDFPVELLDDFDELKRFDKMTVIHDRYTKLIASLATKMRLTPQSRYTPDAATTANKRAGNSKPWGSQ